MTNVSLRLAKETKQMTSIKKLSIMCVAAAWVLVIAGEAMGQWEAQWEKTVAAAKKEGELSVYLNAPAQVRPALTKAFDEKFGIKLYVVTGTGPELSAKIVSEYGRATRGRY